MTLRGLAASWCLEEWTLPTLWESTPGEQAHAVNIHAAKFACMKQPGRMAVHVLLLPAAKCNSINANPGTPRAARFRLRRPGQPYRVQVEEARSTL